MSRCARIAGRRSALAVREKVAPCALTSSLLEVLECQADGAGTRPARERSAMIDVTTALDDAYDRMAQLDFELPNGFVNHGPMACEALAVLGLDDQIEG